MSDPVTPNDKPNGRRLGWRIEETAYPFRNQFLTLRQDKLSWPDGQTGSYSYVETKPVVLIVPVTTTRDVVLIRQYRYTIDDWVWEIPAGGSHDFDGDDLAELARRELREEVGGEAGTLTYVGIFHPAIASFNADFHLYLATGVTLGQAAPEPGEMIEVHRFSIDEAIEMARDGTMAGSSSAYALLRCEPRLRELEGLIGSVFAGARATQTQKCDAGKALKPGLPHYGSMKAFRPGSGSYSRSRRDVRRRTPRSTKMSAQSRARTGVRASAMKWGGLVSWKAIFEAAPPVPSPTSGCGGAVRGVWERERASQRAG